MVWHDCKTDPPKKDGEYILCYDFRGELDWDRAFYKDGIPDWSYEELIPYKWAEVDLSEVESMNNISKTSKASTPNPNLNYKPPIGNHIPVVEIIHSKDGIYDVYIDSQWQVSRNHIDNVLQHLADYVGTFTLKFKDLTLYKE